MLLSLLISLRFVGSVHAQGEGNRAGLVIVHGDGRVVTRCVAFEEPQISGHALLQRSGLAFSSGAGPMGITLCRLDGEGCPASDCWCQCKGTPCAYWTYFHRNLDGSWTYANMGASMRQLGDGDVDAWVWGDGSQAPPVLSFEAICTAGASAPAPDSATATVVPPETVEVTPTATPSPSPTSTPVVATPTSVTAMATPAVSTTAAASDSETRVGAQPSPTPDPSPTATGTPFSEPSSTPSPDVTVAAEPTQSEALLPTPTVDTPSEEGEQNTLAEQASEAPGPPRGYVAFAALLIVVLGLFLILRRAQGA